MKPLLILITVVLLSACSSTSRVDRYKALKQDAAVLCEGSLDNIEYSDSKYVTTIKCGNKKFKFTNEQKKGLAKFLDQFAL